MLSVAPRWFFRSILCVCNGGPDPCVHRLTRACGDTRSPKVTVKPLVHTPWLRAKYLYGKIAGTHPHRNDRSSPKVASLASERATQPRRAAVTPAPVMACRQVQTTRWKACSFACHDGEIGMRHADVKWLYSSQWLSRHDITCRCENRRQVAHTSRPFTALPWHAMQKIRTWSSCPAKQGISPLSFLTEQIID
jgi:hypothetical protein